MATFQQPLNVAPTGQPQQLWGGTTPGVSILYYNPDSANTVYLGYVQAITIGGVNTIALGPQKAFIADGGIPVWQIGTAGTAATLVAPGASSFFLPTSLSNIGGSKVYVQNTTPTGTIPTNSIWFNTSNSSLETYNGTTWVAETFDANQIIQAATILGTQIANQAITASKVANGTLTTTQLAAAAGILGAQIAAATITSANIAANTIVAANIAANTITASQLAAGIVYAGIVDGTTISGSQFIAHGSSGEVLVYSGTPAANNMVASISAAAGTDAQGNAYLAGFTSYLHDVAHSQYVACQHTDNGMQFLNSTTEAGPWAATGNSITATVLGLFIAGNGTDGITLTPSTGPVIVQGPMQATSTSEFDGTITLKNGLQSSTVAIDSGNGHPVFSKEIELSNASTPSTPGSGIRIWTPDGVLNKFIGTDGSGYTMGKRLIMFTGTQTVSSTSFVTLNDGTNNLSSNVSANKYKFHARIIYQPSGTTGTPNFEITSPAFTGGGAIFTLQYNGIASGFARYSNTSGFGTTWVSVANTTAGSGTSVAVDILGTAAFSASGTIVVKANIGGAGNSNIVVQQGSFLEVEPIG